MFNEHVQKYLLSLQAYRLPLKSSTPTKTKLISQSDAAVVTADAPSRFCLFKVYENRASKQHSDELTAKTQMFHRSSLPDWFSSPLSVSKCKVWEWCSSLKETWKSFKLWKRFGDAKLRRLPVFDVSVWKFSTGLWSSLVFARVFSSSCFESIIACLALSWGEMFHVALSSFFLFFFFSHLTFIAAAIMLEKIFCKSMKTALFINPLLSIRLYFYPISLLPLWYSTWRFISSSYIFLRLCVHR